MNAEEIPIVPIIVGTLGLLYFGYEVERQRHKLRQIFNVFDREESEIASMLENMVESGQLTPFVPAAPCRIDRVNFAEPRFPEPAHNGRKPRPQS